MSTQSNAIPDYSRDSQMSTPAVMAPTRPMYWSLRRELWENRSIYIAPLAAAALFLLGYLISMIHLRHKLNGGLILDPMQQHDLMDAPYSFAALLIMGTTIIVAVFYCLDALYGERRDRSILFWKSLPVSDLTTVLSKASIPLLILPLLTFAITVVTQWVTLLISTAALAGSTLNVGAVWSQVSWFQMSMILLFHLLAIHGLWYAPFYGWFMLVSAWARRAPFVWAILPPFAIAMVEKIAFNTSYFAALLQSRVRGPEAVAFAAPGHDSMHALTLLNLGQFLSSPGLWIGLAFFAACLAAAMRLRRSQGPI